MRNIRGGMGLGDALYVQAVARHLTRLGERLKVCTAWPEVFLPLGEMVTFAPFRRQDIQILAHYSIRKSQPTTQFQDVCIQAGIDGPVELKLDWTPTSDLGEQLKRYELPIICVQMARTPMNRTDGFGKELLPDCRVLQRMVHAMKGRALIVQIGSGVPLFKFAGIDIDLSNKTTVCELIDVVQVASGVLGYVSFALPLAESLGKPCLMVWSHRGLKCGTTYVRQITPQKVLHAPTSKYVLDSVPEQEVLGALSAIL